jgi:hypothetical protein
MPSVSLSWGPVSVEAPGPAVGFMVAVDPVTPAFFIHGDQSGTPIPISTSTALGFSADQNFQFTPETAWDVPSGPRGSAGALAHLCIV